MITPTVGRVVHFRTSPEGSPQAGFLTGVYDDRLVDVTIFPPGGSPEAYCKVPLRQPDDVAPEGPHCAWMPYQVKKDTGSESGEKEAGTEVITPSTTVINNAEPQPEGSTKTQPGG